jgi:hypothetical protein
MSRLLIVRQAVAIASVAATAIGCGGSPAKPADLPEALTVTSLTPNLGAADAVTGVFINGTGFTAGASVTIGGAATDVSVLSSRSISARTPPHAEGVVDVVVTNPDGQTARLPGAFTYATLGLKSVAPAKGIIGKWLRVSGVGFLTGIKVSIDGQDARVIFESSASLFALAPPHPPGAVDVVATNPNGRSATLAPGFTYEPVTLSVSAIAVTAGTPVTVTWIAPPGQSDADWIGLYRVEDTNIHALRYEYTHGAQSGALKFDAPDVPGRYEFRYLSDDDYNEAARSPSFTVTARTSLSVPAAAGLLRLPGWRQFPRHSSGR